MIYGWTEGVRGSAWQDRGFFGRQKERRRVTLSAGWIEEDGYLQSAPSPRWSLSPRKGQLYSGLREIGLCNTNRFNQGKREPLRTRNGLNFGVG